MCVKSVQTEKAEVTSKCYIIFNLCFFYLEIKCWDILLGVIFTVKFTLNNTFPLTELNVT